VRGPALRLAALLLGIVTAFALGTCQADASGRAGDAARFLGDPVNPVPPPYACPPEFLVLPIAPPERFRLAVLRLPPRDQITVQNTKRERWLSFCRDLPKFDSQDKRRLTVQLRWRFGSDRTIGPALLLVAAQQPLAAASAERAGICWKRR
jgi:hypothetical protein